MPTVSTTNGTYLANLFNPQVVGDRIEKKLLTTSVSLRWRESTTTS